MRLHALGLAAALALASGCTSSAGGLEKTSGPAGYVEFESYDRTLETSQLGIRRNFVPSAAGPPVSFNLVMSYQEGILYGSPSAAPPEMFVWVGYRADDSLGLGEESALALSVDGSEVVLPGASDSRRRRTLLSPFRNSTEREFEGGIELGTYPFSQLAEMEFGRGGEFGLYLLPSEVVRQLTSATEVRFEILGAEGDVERELGPTSLRNVQRFLRERDVLGALRFLS